MSEDFRNSPLYQEIADRVQASIAHGFALAKDKAMEEEEYMTDPEAMRLGERQALGDLMMAFYRVASTVDGERRAAVIAALPFREIPGWVPGSCRMKPTELTVEERLESAAAFVRRKGRGKI